LLYLLQVFSLEVLSISLLPPLILWIGHKDKTEKKALAKEEMRDGKQ